MSEGNRHRDYRSIPGQPSGKVMNERSMAAIGDRLRPTRMAPQMSQIVFCTKAGLTATAYSHQENGRARPSFETANALCDTYQRGLRPDLAEAIKALRKMRQDQPLKKRKP
jgi:transcriptional regulator with XRE-family HTH domain